MNSFFALRFSMESDHFNHLHRPEACAEILREIADNLDNHITGGKIVDVNGNRIGTYTTEGE